MATKKEWRRRVIRGMAVLQLFEVGTDNGSICNPVGKPNVIGIDEQDLFIEWVVENELPFWWLAILDESEPDTFAGLPPGPAMHLRSRLSEITGFAFQAMSDHPAVREAIEAEYGEDWHELGEAF